MSRLTDIIDAAEGDEVSTQSLLRRVKVLAARIETVPLVDWVEKELGGYSLEDDIPSYRGPFNADVLSEWSGPYGWEAKGIALPPSLFPQGLRDAGAFKVVFHQSVAELERIAQLDGRLAVPWDADIVARINGEIHRGEMKPLFPLPGIGMVSAYRQVTPALVESVLDNVRNRVLTFALDLEKIAPQAGEPDAPAVDPATVAPMVYNFYGSNNAYAIGSNATVAVPKGDLDALLSAARARGLPDVEVDELRAAIEGDEADDSEPASEPGSRVAKFLGRLTLGAGKIAGQEGAKELGRAVSDLILSYHGLR